MTIPEALSAGPDRAAPPPHLSGRYRGSRAGVEVELRIDIDGPRATRRVSADYFQQTRDVHEYIESMRLDAPRVTVVRGVVSIRGTALFSRGIRRRTIEVTIPRGRSGRPPATLRHVASGGARARPWVCEFEADSFRDVELEEAVEEGVERPPAFDTGTLPSACHPPRTLSAIDVFADAGIRLVSTGEPKVIRSVEAGRDGAWTDAELHAAMEQHFSRFGDDPRWAIWLLHAADHVNPRLSGIMFDHLGGQRQGCAVFYGREPAASDHLRRARLYNCVHELGHGFNLPHCWQRAMTTPPIESRPDAHTWMNYPERHRRGEDGFFEAFGFQFDDAEVVHLRHAFRQQVIMGGDPFLGNAAREGIGGRTDRTDWTADRRDHALRLTLSVPATIAQHLPVIARLELTNTARTGRDAPKTLDPRAGSVDIAIRTPGGEDRLFEPLLRHCRGAEATTLHPAATLRDFPFLHYGKNGFAFDRPGAYRVQARYTGPDGLVALSNLATLRVRPPMSREDRRVADLVAGDEQVGTLLSLMGSRAPALERGNEKLREVIRSHPGHPLASVARIVQATSLARAFKTIRHDGVVETAPARSDVAIRLIRPIFDIDAALRAARAVDGEEAQQEAFADALQRLPMAPGIGPLLTAFMGSRGSEIAIVRDNLVRVPVPAPTRRPPPYEQPPPEQQPPPTAD